MNKRNKSFFKKYAILPTKKIYIFKQNKFTKGEPHHQLLIGKNKQM